MPVTIQHFPKLLRPQLNGLLLQFHSSAQCTIILDSRAYQVVRRLSLSEWPTGWLNLLNPLN